MDPRSSPRISTWCTAGPRKTWVVWPTRWRRSIRLGEAAGGGTYDALLPRSEVRELYTLACRFVTLEGLIHLKRSAGRPKDLERIAELEALREERDAGTS